MHPPFSGSFGKVNPFPRWERPVPLFTHLFLRRVHEEKGVVEEKAEREKQAARFWGEEQGCSTAPDWLPKCSMTTPSSSSSLAASAP